MHGCGRLLMFASAEPKECRLNGSAIGYEYDNRVSRLIVTLPKEDGLDHRLSVIF